MDDQGNGRGTAGASARREHDRRRAGREARVRGRHPRLGGLLLAVQGAPSHERAWAVGADGEAMTAAALAKRCGDEVVILHDRRIPGSRANIDHIAVAPSGVWVIDSKRYKGMRVAVTRPLLGKERLTVGGRDQAKLMAGLDRQLAVVRSVVGEAADGPPVRGALCFVDAEWPLLAGALGCGGHTIATPAALAKKLNGSGRLRVYEVAQLAAELARHLPAA